MSFGLWNTLNCFVFQGGHSFDVLGGGHAGLVGWRNECVQATNKYEIREVL